MAAAAILDSQKFDFLTVTRVGRDNVRYLVKIGGDR